MGPGAINGGWGSRPSPSPLRGSPRLPSRVRPWKPGWPGGGTSAYGLAPRACRSRLRARRSACGWPACCAAPSGRARAPRPGAFRLRGGPRPAPLGPLAALRHRLRGSPRRARLAVSVARAGAWPPRRAALGGPGVPALGRALVPAGSPLGSRPGPPCAPPCSGAPGAAAVAFRAARVLPCALPSRRPRWGLREARGPSGWASPPVRFAVGSPVGRASRAPLRHPAPVGAGPRGPLFGAVVNPEIVNPPRVRPVRVPSDRSAGPHIPAARPAFTACPAPGASPFFPSGAARGLTSYAKRDMLMFRGPFHSFRGVAASAVSTDGKKSPPNFQGGDFSYSEPSQPCRN